MLVKDDCHRYWTEKPCDLCYFIAENYASLKEHDVAEHGVIIYPCTFCNKNLVSVEGLRRHDLHYHSEKYDENAQLLYCDQCEFQSYGKYQLKRHIQSVHSKEENTVNIRGNQGNLYYDTLKQFMRVRK